MSWPFLFHFYKCPNVRSSSGTGSSYSYSSNFKANLRRQKRRERWRQWREGEREREQQNWRKKGKNTLRRQIKNVNIIVCVIVLARGVGMGRGAWPGGVKMFLNLAQKRLTTTFAIVSPWHKHTQPSSALAPSLSLFLSRSPFPSVVARFHFFLWFWTPPPMPLPSPLPENMPQGMNTLSQLIASAGNNLETSLLLLAFYVLYEPGTSPFLATHTHTHTPNITLCPCYCCCFCALRRLRKTF